MADGGLMAELEAMISELSEEELAQLDEQIAPELAAKWIPSPGRQTEAYLSDADMLLYGGGAGGGKSQLLLGLALMEHKRSVMFRRSYADVAALADDFVKISGRQGYASAPRPVYKAVGQLVEFGALEAPGAEMSWMGRRHDFIGFDEGGQLTAAKIKFVMGWLGSPTEGQRCRVVIASNPPQGGDGAWMLEWFAPWLDPLFADPATPGELRWAYTKGDETIWVDGPGVTWIEGEEYAHRSRTFIPSLVDDNPYLRDTGYKATLQNMPEPLRSQLLHGDFLAGRQDHEWQVIPTEWVRAAQERWKRAPEKRRRMLALSADVAIGGVDNNALSALHEDNWFAPIVHRKGIETTEPHQVADLMLATRRDGADLSVDGTGGWGSGVAGHLKTHHQVECAQIVYSTKVPNSRTKDGKLEFYNLRSKMYWRLREALDPDSGEEVMIPPDQRITAQLTAARYGLKGTKILLESKDEIKSRIGASPDDADSMVQVWHRRTAAAKAAVKQQAKHRVPTPVRSSAQGWMVR